MCKNCVNKFFPYVKIWHFSNFRPYEEGNSAQLSENAINEH